MSENEQAELDCYYTALWKKRLGWTQHFIPVRARHQLAGREYFYFEGYLLAPAKVWENEEEEKQSVPIKLATLPTTRYDSIHVHYSNIYPTSRRITKLDDETEEIVPVTEELAIEDKYQPTHKVRSTVKNLQDLEDRLPGRDWTLRELQSAFNNNLSDSILKTLVPTGKERNCQLDQTLEKTFFLREPEKELETFTLEELSEKNKDLVPAADKQSTLRKLCTEYNSCTRCELGVDRLSRRANLVFGRGSVDATGIIIAESPWEQEERDNKPLHPNAPAGGKLYEVMSKVGMNQDDWFLTNSVICRPYLNKGAGPDKNKPTQEHIDACSSRLKQTLQIVQPKIVVLLGKIAYEAWFREEPGTIKDAKGWVHKTYDGSNPINYYVYFTYHPSYIQRQKGTWAKGIEENYISDWKEIAAKFNELRK
jgi:DNA polymerase